MNRRPLYLFLIMVVFIFVDFFIAFPKLIYIWQVLITGFMALVSSIIFYFSNKILEEKTRKNNFISSCHNSIYNFIQLKYFLYNELDYIISIYIKNNNKFKGEEINMLSRNSFIKKQSINDTNNSKLFEHIDNINKIFSNIKKYTNKNENSLFFNFSYFYVEVLCMLVNRKTESLYNTKRSICTVHNLVIIVFLIHYIDIITNSVKNIDNSFSIKIEFNKKKIEDILIYI